MKSGTKILRQAERKRNPDLVGTIVAAKKNGAWKEVAEVLSSPRKNMPQMNVEEISGKTGDEKTVVVPGKVLSSGEINKKIKVVALRFSDGAEEKLKNAGCELATIAEEIKSNPEAKGVKILGK